jgi:hypothetical protein
MQLFRRCFASTGLAYVPPWTVIETVRKELELAIATGRSPTSV